MTDDHKKYGVFYWSAFNNKWIEYTTIGFQPEPKRFALIGDAEEHMRKLQRMHPNDKLKVGIA